MKFGIICQSYLRVCSCGGGVFFLCVFLSVIVFCSFGIFCGNFVCFEFACCCWFCFLFY